MASSYTTDKEQEQHSSMEEACAFVYAWKSVKKHFPNSHVQSAPDTSTNSIILYPILNVDLTIVFCFDIGQIEECPKVNVTSQTINKIFINELEQVLIMKCNDLTEWQTLGDEIEKILQCVEMRKGKGVKKKKKKCRKNVRSKSLEQNNSDDELVSQDELHFKLNSCCIIQEEKKLRPNYFIAVRIHDKATIQNISKLQTFLISQESLLTKGVIPSEALHLTLCNLGLDSADDLLSAIEAFNRMKPQLHQILPKSPFIVHGVSQFYNRAIYAKVTLGDDLIRFIDMIRTSLKEAGLEFREDHEVFTPHVTIVKVRRPERRAFGTRNIQPSIYESYIGSVHGNQMVEAIYLCAMGGQKREDGFYVTAAELQFTSKQT